MSAIPAADRVVSISHNAPTAIDLANEAMADLVAYANDNPAVTDHDQSKDAEAMIKRGKEAAKDLEAERKAKVKPLDDARAEIQGTYRPVADRLDTAIDVIEKRRKAFLKAEEDRRIAAAAEAARKAAEAERLAREAEAKERAALAEAQAGVADAGAIEATVAADTAFDEFARASRFAAVAQRDSKVKGLRTTEVLTVTNIAAAVIAMANDQQLIADVLSAGRRHRKVMGDLPVGIIATQERV